MNGTEQVLAMHRFGLGASPRDLIATANSPRESVLEQLALQQPVYPDTLPTASDHLARIAQFKATSVRDKKQLNKRMKAEANRDLQKLFQRRTELAIESSTPFVERLVHFWSNHFAVSGKKSSLGPAASAFEFEVIRPHVLGSFKDMILAAESHPAMLKYLDNTRSIGAASNIASSKHRNRKTYGINENLAREILELHSLGVRSGYTQRDVTELSKALTGWTVSSLRHAHASSTPGIFQFVEDMHEPGERLFLGKRYPEAGLEQARMMLQDLASHEVTASHIATKLCCHFVDDDPPPQLVKRVSGAYQSSGGNLVDVYMKLLFDDMAWQPPLNKWKTPEQFVLSSLRTLEIGAVDTNYLVKSLKAMGQAPNAVPSPAGWPEEADAFAGSTSTLGRIEFAHQLASLAAGNQPAELYRQSFGPMATTIATREISGAESIAQGFALFLLSPEFQRR